MSNFIYKNMDCMEGMKEFPDKFFQLAIVDPPYGINRDGQKLSINKISKYNRKYFEHKGWDKNIPNNEYFDELFRVSENQIIWGANYFVKYLLEGKKGWIVWYKGQEGLTMSDLELAYSSFNKPSRIIIINRVELLKEGTIHPTQKPIALYKWLLKNYAKPGDKILDTHVGSGSSIIACLDMGFDVWGFEIDKDYYDASMKRINQYLAQGRLFEKPDQNLSKQISFG